MNGRTQLFIVGVCSILLLALLLSVALYVTKFGGPLSNNHTHWGEFGSYISGVLGVSLTAATLAIAVYATAHLPQQLEAQKAAADRAKATVEMSRTLYDRDFYINVSVPAWEIAVKWMHWEGAEGDEYRRKVCGGMFFDYYPPFRTQQAANSHSYQNLIRFGSHFMPYDRSEKLGTDVPEYIGTIGHLSEHQVLVIWLQFWRNLQALVKANLVDEELVRVLFRDWYGSWLQFMLELRFAGNFLTGTHEPDGAFRSAAVAEADCLPGIQAMEDVLYQSSPTYLAQSERASSRARLIAERTVELHNLSIVGSTCRDA